MLEAGPEDDNWMEAELSALQAEADALGEDEEVYSDPGADSFFASLEDIENLEQGGGDIGDAGANAFVAGSAVFKGGSMESYKANISAIRNAAQLARGEAI